MKTTLLSLLLSAAALTAFTTRVFAQKSGDEAAIRQVIDATQLAVDNRDIKALGVHFIQSPDFYFRVTPSDGNGMVLVANGYDNAIKMIGGHLNDVATVKPPKHTLSQYAVHINGSSAWTTYILTDELPDGQKINACQFSVLEKKAGIWKVAAMTWQDYPGKKLVVVE